MIAQTPATERDGSRLLVVRRSGGQAVSDNAHLSFRDFPSLVEPGDLLVVNDSRVIPARLLGTRSGGGAAEVFLVAREADGTWRALVKPGAKLQAGRSVRLGGGDSVLILDHLETGERRVRLDGRGGDAGVLERHGKIPLPPYIEREATEEDAERYQTIYARAPGSVAAPTAGLHFTDDVLKRIEERGAGSVGITLHVGPGTFRPVSAENPDDHVMDAEWWSMSEDTAAVINDVKADGGKIWAVGTTACRTLESAARADGTVAAGSGTTTLFIRPGYEFKVVDRLLTNFHLPRSTLLMLVCAFAGTERVMAAYREAVAQRYRFYSYGDAMALL